MGVITLHPYTGYPYIIQWHNAALFIPLNFPQCLYFSFHNSLDGASELSPWIAGTVFRAQEWIELEMSFLSPLRTLLGFEHMIQPIDQPTYWPTAWPTYVLTDLPTYVLTDLFQSYLQTDWPTDHATDQLSDQPAYQQIFNLQTDQTTDFPIDWLMSWWLYLLEYGAHAR